MEFQVAEFSRHIELLMKRASETFSRLGINNTFDHQQRETVRLVFAGQYNAGKSSILRMLTGRTDIEIGAGITTQKANTYNWNGLEVTDTPGIHTELRPDHDTISYDAIASADLLIFVITNELFDSHLAEHFRKLAIDRDKAGEMILVVNKMERASQGNTPEQQEVLRDDLRRVLAPYSPEKLHLCFLDAESYLDSLDERESDPEMADELLARSGYDSFVQTLNDFVYENSVAAKITTQLYKLEEHLQKTVHELEPQNEDRDIAALEEHYWQQKHIFTDARYRLQQELSAIFANATTKIRDIGLDAANLLVDGCDYQAVEEQLTDMVHQVETITDQCQENVRKTAEERLSEIGQHLDDIEDSEFARNLKTSLSSRTEGLPADIQKLLMDAGPSLQRIGQNVVDKAYKIGVNGGLKLTNFSGSAVHNIVLKVGHFFGHNFKPWQAVKWTKNVAIGGNVLGVLGAGLQLFMQFKNEKDEDAAREALQKERQNIRGQFFSVAEEFDDFGKQFIKENIVQALAEPVYDIDQSLQSIKDDRDNRNDTLKQLRSLQHDCQQLIRSIHGSEAL